MFAGFEYKSVPLKDIELDDRNPRLVTQTKLTSQQEILSYLYEHEGLEAFIKKIVTEGKNPGAERPYVVKKASVYTVIEGNTRIAAYKVLTGLLKPPSEYVSTVPHISASTSKGLEAVDCSIAPNRDSLLPIMANAHFGLGDKSKWGYLGSRKAVYDEWKAGKSITKLAKAFDRTPSQIKELIIEYMLYQKALTLHWTSSEKAALLNPAVEFNPPVRFLQTSGHKAKMGINYDMANLKISFSGSDALKKFKHLLLKLVIKPQRGLGATAGYDDVFADYGSAAGKKSKAAKSSTKAAAGNAVKGSESNNGTSTAAKPTALFTYQVTITNALVSQLMREAKDINYKKLPAAATFLLRNIIESILKHLIDQQKANPASKSLDLESAINLCLSNAVSIGPSDKKILKEFSKQHLSYLNLGAHGNVIPNPERVSGARDCIDQFVKKFV